MMRRRQVLLLGAMTVLLGSLVSASGWNDNPSRRTFLTFSVPAGLPGVTLGAGTYSFEIANPASSLEVVRVTNREGSRVYFTGFTQLVNRPAGMPVDEQVSLGEPGPSHVQPIVAWYPLGESTGHQFIYARR
jgi:hypothetical protein